MDSENGELSREDSKPNLVVCENSSVFGGTAKVTGPFRDVFVCTQACSSNLNWGVSLNAIVDLASKEGY